jgi:hypothetical protein
MQWVILALAAHKKCTDDYEAGDDDDDDTCVYA